jgi:short-subunit dehydrogenase
MSPTTSTTSAPHNPTYAVVTGASQGIGKSIALQLAQRNITPILVARSTEKLAALAEEIRTQHGLEPMCLPCDLGIKIID